MTSTCTLVEAHCAMWRSIHKLVSMHKGSTMSSDSMAVEAAVNGSVETAEAALAILDQMENGAMNGETTVDTAPVLEAESSKKDPEFVHVPFANCPDLLAVLRSKAGNTPLGPFVAAYLCEQMGVAYDNTDGRKRHNTEEEKKAAIKASQQKRADKIKLLSAQHKAKLAGNKAEVDRIEAILYPPKV
jgi:hypothetical protein